MDTSTEKENIFSEEGIKNITAFSSALGKVDSRCLDNLSREDRCKLTGFFELLIKVDKRVNPHLYKGYTK